MSTTVNGNKVYENVTYKGEQGSLTLTDKVFHYQANIVDATVKCSWARVEKRQLSPPGAAQPMLKLVLVSGKTAIFEVATTSILLELVKDVKIRMESNKPSEQAPGQQSNDDTDNPKTKRSAITPQPTNVEDGNSSDSEDDDAPHQKKPQRRPSKPPSLEGGDPYLSNAHDKRDDSRATLWYCPWESIYCWLCLAATVAVFVLIALLIYFFLIQNDGGKDNNTSTSASLCEDPLSPSCPPDDGLEKRYGIRAVEYVWTPELVRLEYYISDYILDTSINYTIYDGVECRGSEDQVVPDDNDWLRVDLVDGAPTDGGANLYNEGKGTRQFDIVLSPRTESNLQQAPFYTFNAAAANRGFLRVCVGFSVLYNRIDDFEQAIEVNYIENALQLRIGTAQENWGVIEDVQIKTVTRPEYK